MKPPMPPFHPAEYVSRFETTYAPAECAVFCKTREAFGALSNMAFGYPITVNGQEVRTSEALYQCMRFPGHPDVQVAILASRSPMSAKMTARKHLALTRPGWDKVRSGAMWWSLCAKLHGNYRRFAAELEATGDRDIVERSHKDAFWGALPQPDGTLKGLNHLGHLLMALRALARDRTMWSGPLAPPTEELLDGALFLGEPIRPIAPP